MKAVLRWEIDLYLNYLHTIPFDVQEISVAFTNLVAAQADITVDEFRKMYHMPSPHPDGGTAPARGASLIHATDNPQAGDDAIPQAVLDAARDSIEAANDALVENKLTAGQLEAKYPELWAVT